MNGSIQITTDGGEPVSISFDKDVTAAEIQAGIDAAIGPGRVLVGASSIAAPTPALAPMSYAYPLRPPFRQTWRATEDSPRARRYHAPGCRWDPGNRRWTCVDACRVPEMIEEEAADDD